MAAGLSYAHAEWLVALRRRRAFVLNMIVPAAFAAALLSLGAPAVHASVVITVLFAFFGTFGSAIPLARDLETGRFSRLVHTGASCAFLLFQRVVVSALLDFLQLLPAIALLAFARNGSAAPALAAGTFAALLFANVVGAWIGAWTRSIGEAALIASVSALLLLHVGGVFRTPVPGSIGAALRSVSPFGYLHDAVRSGFGIGDPHSAVPLLHLIAISAAAIASLVLLPRAMRDLKLQYRR